MNKNFLIIFVFILFTNNSLACDALRLTGTKVSTAQKTFFIIDGYSEEDFDEWNTVQYMGYAADFEEECYGDEADYNIESDAN